MRVLYLGDFIYSVVSVRPKRTFQTTLFQCYHDTYWAIRKKRRRVMDPQPALQCCKISPLHNSLWLVYTYNIVYFAHMILLLRHLECQRLCSFYSRATSYKQTISPPILHVPSLSGFFPVISALSLTLLPQPFHLLSNAVRPQQSRARAHRPARPPLQDVLLRGEEAFSPAATKDT